MAYSVPLLSNRDDLIFKLKSDLVPGISPLQVSSTCGRFFRERKNLSTCSPITCSAFKLVRDRSLDRHAVRQNQIRFVQKLKTLLLSKPKHFIPLHILSKCRSYLALSKPRSIMAMIHRYPMIFELFTVPMPPIPLNATKPCSQLCVRLTPAASALAAQESNLKSTMSSQLASKLQKLLMLSSHHRILLSKLVHLGPDLGLPPNFRSRLCNDHPDRFKTVDTSYGRALELVSWNQQLAQPLLPPRDVPRELIVDRPSKFKRVKLRRGLNLKRRHEAFLIKFNELPDICPYKTSSEEIVKESLEAEKRACAVVREVLGMTVERRTLIDHLTHFRKDFGLPNKLRSMIIRHPELFYVSVKGQRDSVFLVEGFNDKGELLEREESLVIKHQLLELVREGKRFRREKRRAWHKPSSIDESRNYVLEDDSEILGLSDEDYDDGFENLFDSADYDMEDYGDFELNERNEMLELEARGEFWVANGSSTLDGSARHLESW
ncbi:hypothetical protein SAY87_021204 [Trapa incisa]|uniref:PORR domain-containing protein n=1 Tax=Trapa incisa TaxID=236973 RepID=A0AAN7JRF0_9MYRT|nr:hypothetical protein SAY87_021204 [Trapa incisa]